MKTGNCSDAFENDTAQKSSVSEQKVQEGLPGHFAQLPHDPGGQLKEKGRRNACPPASFVLQGEPRERAGLSPVSPESPALGQSWPGSGKA